MLPFWRTVKFMDKIRRSQTGFSATEAVLAVVIAVIVGFIAWYVFHAKHTTDKNPGTAGSSTHAGSGTPKSSAAGTYNRSLQNDLDGINSTNSQAAKDLNASNGGLNDTSTFTSVPQ
jgi:cell division protein FtsN